MNIISSHIISSLRLLDGERQGIRTLSRIRPGIGAVDVGNLLDGFNMLMKHPAMNAVLTTQAELKEAA